MQLNPFSLPKKETRYVTLPTTAYTPLMCSGLILKLSLVEKPATGEKGAYSQLVSLMHAVLLIKYRK
jgi:hypothetical protein